MDEALVLLESIRNDTGPLCFSRCYRLLELKSRASVVTLGDLADCGPASLYLLSTGLRLLETPVSAPQAQDCFQALLDLSNERILAYPYREVPDYWRRLYTDATLLRVLTLFLANFQASQQEWKTAVRDLDKVLIVAGAAGHCRQEYTHALIRLVQQHHLGARQSQTREAILRLSSTPSDAFTLHDPIRRFTSEAAPSIEAFLSSAHITPFIISRGVSHWPAFAKWTSLDYLRSTAGPGRVVPIEVGGTYTQDTWSQEMMDFDTFLDALSSSPSSSDKASSQRLLYLAQHDLLRQLPSLEDDFYPPDYVYMSPPATDDAPSYSPPDADRGYLVNLWIGPSNTHSPAHTDPYYNCYGQVVGRKLLWVASPQASQYMYPFGTPVEEQPDEPDPTGLQEQYMGNTSRVDVLTTCEQDQQALQEQQKSFPRFFEKAMPLSQQAVLGPGDLLFLPPGWWHALKSLDSAISVSLWF